MRRCLINTCLALILIFLAVVSGLALKEYLTARADAFLRAEAAKVADLARITWDRLDIRLRQPGLVLHQARITTPRGHEVAMGPGQDQCPVKTSAKALGIHPGHDRHPYDQISGPGLGSARHPRHRDRSHECRSGV